MATDQQHWVEDFLQWCPRGRSYLRDISQPPRPIAFNDVMRSAAPDPTEEIETKGIELPPGVESELVEAWLELRNKGVVAFGATQTGKTTAIYAMLRELARQGDLSDYASDFKSAEGERRAVIEVTGAQLVEGIIRTSMHGGLDDLRYNLENVPILFLDDIDKAKWSLKAESVFLDVLKVRMENDNQVLITSSVSGTRLRGMFSKQHVGDAIVARLRSRRHFRSVNFDIG